MKPIDLGRLEKVDLRGVFASESGDFTPWLAKSENLALLGETIGVSLELEAQEKPVGLFRADILCKDADTEQWVLIENQIERTDHTHLGQVLTYTAGLDAVTIVWIAERFTDEHRAALDWLNEKTQTGINFFGLEIELWKIGDSAVAPKFNVVSQPNEWSKNTRGPAGSGEGAGAQELQLRFWTGFAEFLEEKHSAVSCSKPKAQRTMVHPLGVAGAHLASIATVFDAVDKRIVPELRVALILKGENAEELFAYLKGQNEKLSQTIGEELIYLDEPNKSRCLVLARKKTDFRDEKLWPEQQAWLRKTLERFQEVFVPILKSVEPEELPADMEVGAK